ncbi:MAG: endolytic transglycosylase MltG [Chloroflexi bacterium]|nr:endolytic transglycosylase MltG [Chloroflexota bacterium]MQC17630.1 endolytic transglycosylase MltG [Chloroflexota bacterium]
MREPRDIAAVILGVVVLGILAFAGMRVAGSDDAVAARLRASSEVSVSAVTAEGMVDVEIREGASPNEIVDRLAQVGVVGDVETMRTLMLFTGTAEEFRAGRYEFAVNTPPAEVIRRLREGPPRIERITFRAGLRVEEIGETLEEVGYFSYEEWETAVDTAERRAFMGEETDFLGFLMPGTYEVDDETTAASLLEEMLDRFEELVTEDLIAEAEAQGWTLYEVLTLASVVESEAVHPEEKPEVAAVFRNRVSEGMPLQADPTVQFALTIQPDGVASVAEYSWWKRGLTVDDLILDSFYNTYLYPGLMPGPIANPDIDSIRATISPAPVDYYYFVASPACDGRHLFGATLDEHNANVELFRASDCANEDDDEAGSGPGA